MKNQRVKICFLLGISMLFLASCREKQHQQVQGYIEGQLTYITPQVGGLLEQLAVQRGDAIRKDQLLFQLNPAPENDQLGAALATVYQARAQLKDLLKGQRAPKIKALIAVERQAQSDLVYARKQLRRYRRLNASGFVSRQLLNQEQNNYQSARARVNEAKENIFTAHLSAREDQILAAQGALDASQANVRQAQWRLKQKTQRSPLTGIVYDTYFYAHETVPAGQPVLSVLSPSDLRVIFYVPANQRAELKIGQSVQVHADGNKKLYSGKIVYMSSQAAYTPPLIYSRENNANLVFQVRAKLNSHTWVYWPGQPVLVHWQQVPKAAKA